MVRVRLLRNGSTDALEGAPPMRSRRINRKKRLANNVRIQLVRCYVPAVSCSKPVVFKVFKGEFPFGVMVEEFSSIENNWLV